ncbi:MAG: hypothetical protein ACT4O9_01160 [Blastocatellia bacterium]
MKWTIFNGNQLPPKWVIAFLLSVAVILSAIMALSSDFNRHPDEIHHFEAAKYYIIHFFPPEIGDPAVRESYSVWGQSYLNYHFVEYFLAGKFTYAASLVGINPLAAARFFSVFLFSVLAFFFVYRSNIDCDLSIFPAFLLMTPQVWYVFSYVNNDVFALFLTMIAAYQLGYEKSSLNRFFDDSEFSSRIFGGLSFGLLIGLLFITKPNYWSFVLFSAVWLVFRFSLTLQNTKKFAVIAFVAFSVVGFRIGLDFYVNGETNFAGFSYLNKFFGGSEKKGKLLAYQEDVADYAMKPSTLKNDLANSHKDLALRDKGVSINEMLFKKGWIELSARSFAGVYGYMSIHAKRWMYFLAFTIYGLFLAYIFAAVCRSGDRAGIAQLAITTIGVTLTIFLSIMLSWIYAFQPQGRYLFPVLAMLGLFTYTNRRHLDNRVVQAFVILAFSVSVISFTYWGLTNINVQITSA